MQLDKNSWHYKLVRHREFLINWEKGPSEYILEVGLALFTDYLSFILVLIFIILAILQRKEIGSVTGHAFLLVPLIAASSLPIWLYGGIRIYQMITRRMSCRKQKGSISNRG